MSSIKSLIVEAISTQIKDNINEGLSANSPLRIDIVQPYKYVGSKASKHVISVIPDNFDKTNYIDARVDHKTVDDLSNYYPSGEMGGNTLWFRRGTVLVELFFENMQKLDLTRLNQDAYTIMGKVEYLVQRTTVAGLEDSYRESAVLIDVVSSYFQESGNDTQKIWYGVIHWRVLTAKQR